MLLFLRNVYIISNKLSETEFLKYAINLNLRYGLHKFVRSLTLDQILQCLLCTHTLKDWISLSQNVNSGGKRLIICFSLNKV